MFVTVALSVVALSGASNICDNHDDAYYAIDPNGDCQDYFGCHQGVAHPMRCPDGLYFDVDRQMCYYSELVNCHLESDPCYGLAQWTFLPNHDEGCAAFIRCDNNRSEYLRCPDGLQFDPNTDGCNFPEYVDCADPIPPLPTTPAATTPSSTTPQTPNPNDPRCSGKSDNTLVPDIARGCAAFLQCFNQYAILPQMCPDPFWFDFPRQMCNHQENVDCVE
jgi:Chitin binding Peritrophin-A domain